METPFAAYVGDEACIFVCYAHEDSDVVYPEMAWLRDQGVNLWYDEGISAGKNWRTAIGDSLLGASHILFYVSAGSLKSDHCNREINLALDEGKEVVPVYIEDVELTTDLKVGLSRVQALHREQDASYQQHLLNALGHSTTTSALPSKATPERRRSRFPQLVSVGLAGALMVAAGWWFWPRTSEVQVPGAVLTDSPAANRSIDRIDQIELKSIAVLPLDNLSPDPDNAYFAAGVHEEILNQLVKIGDIQVTSRTTVLRYQNSNLSVGDIARELNVGTILEGSVRFAGNRVRITTQLIRATDDFHLWSETYEFELDDIFAIQSDVAIKIAKAMQTNLSPEEIASIERPATENAEAYTLFLQTRYQIEQEGGLPTLAENGYVQVGIRKMEQAVALDPLYATGFAELAYLKFHKAVVSPVGERTDLYEQAVFYAQKAIEIDPTVERAYAALQRISFELRQWDDWDKYGRKSIALPDLNGRAASRFAFTLMLLGQFREAHHWFDVAISRDPSSVLHRWTAVGGRMAGRDYETALALAEQFLAVGGDRDSYHIFRAYAYYRLDRRAESLNEFSKISAEPIALSALYYLAYLRCQFGEKHNVMEKLSNLNEIRSVYCSAGAGDLDRVFESFERRMISGTNIWRGNTNFDGIQDDTRWQTVEEYMNFPTPK